MADAVNGFGNRIGVVTTTPVATLTFLETETQPQGWEGESKVEQSSNANTKFRSFEPGALVEKTASTYKVYYQITQLATIKSVLQARAVITLTSKDGSTDVDNGWIRSFVPDPQVNGQRPTASMVIEWEGESSAGTDSQVITSAS